MLISCVAYEDGKKIAEIPVGEIHDYVGRPDCFVWVALRDAGAPELEQVGAQFGLHPLAVEDARHGHQRPKIEEYGDSVFVVLQMVEMEGDSLRTGEVDIFVGRNYVLSIRSGAEKGFHDVRIRSEREPHLLQHGSGYVLYALMDAVVDRYFPILDSLETELESIEARIFAGLTPQANIKALYTIKQKLMTLKHAIGPLLEASGKLTGGRIPYVCAGLQEYFRDITDHLIRLNQTMDAIRDMVITAMSVNLSMITLQENDAVKKLSAYAALAAVPMMITGIYGMNFHNIPELNWNYGYHFALGLMAVLDGLLFYLFRKAKWL